MNSVCKLCGMPDSARSNGDVDWCNECYSAEQGFLYVTEFEGFNNLVVDEDGMLYIENEELDGAIGCEYVFLK